MIVSIDPGLNHCGVAFWNENTKMLLSARLVKNALSRYRNKWAAMAYELRAAIKEEWDGAPVVEVISELPQIYQGPKQKGDPNDLIDLALVVGRLYPDVLYKPREWKGQVPKDAMVKRIESKLTQEEKGRIEKCSASLRHNVLDAVGIGLFHLGRL